MSCCYVMAYCIVMIMNRSLDEIEVVHKQNVLKQGGAYVSTVLLLV